MPEINECSENKKQAVQTEFKIFLRGFLSQVAEIINCLAKIELSSVFCFNWISTKE